MSSQVKQLAQLSRRLILTRNDMRRQVIEATGDRDIKAAVVSIENL